MGLGHVPVYKNLAQRSGCAERVDYELDECHEWYETEDGGQRTEGGGEIAEIRGRGPGVRGRKKLDLKGLQMASDLLIFTYDQKLPHKGLVSALQEK